MSGEITWYLRILHDTVFTRPPDGTPGIRDIDHPCMNFDPTPMDLEKRPFGGTCRTDGHYICRECNHLDLTSDYATERGMNPNDPGRLRELR